MRKLLLTVLLITLLLCGCGKKVDPIDDNYRVFYEIFVGSFSDSNNDGIGDLRGIINRLDYLNDGDIDSDDSLHIQGIWLTPIFESPSYHKYDVIDYYNVDPVFGTNDDLKELIDECHKRNVKVILDMVINHTSTKNEWFKEFKKAHVNNDITNKYYNYYAFASSDNRKPGHTWYKINGCNDYYEGNFSSDMPELNFNSDDVKREVLDIAKHYLDMGVDGFRFDAAKYIYLGDNENTVSFWNWYTDELKSIKDDVYLVGEVWSSDNETKQYIKEMNCFNFQMANGEGMIAKTAKSGDVNQFASYITSYVSAIKEGNEDAMLIPFISNHDMDRSAGYLMMANRFPYIAANLYILCPGSPFIYYGEEIGLKGSRGGANTDANRRLKMLWGDGDTVENPEGTTFDEGKQTNGTVKDHLENKDSLLNYYIRLIKIRNKYPEIARGEYQAIKNTNKMSGFIITYNNEITGLIHNTSANDELTIDLSDYSFKEIKDYIGMNDASFKDNTLTVGPQTSVIIK